MPLAVGATKACLQVQQFLDQIAGNNVTNLRIENFGLLQWLTSSMNTAGFQGLQNQDPGGKNRTVKVDYWTNPRTAAGTDCTPDICTAGTTTGRKQAEMTLDFCADVSETLDEQEFRDFCDTGESSSSTILGSEFASQLIQGKVNQLLAQIDTDASTYIVAHAGNFYNSIAGPKNITLLRSDGSVYHGGQTTISNDLEDAGHTGGIPAAIGLGYLRTASKTGQIACCDSTGQDFSKVTSPYVYYSDRRIETASVTNRFYVATPGAMQLVSKVKWVGPYVDVRGTNEAKTTVIVPVPGGGTIPVDFTVRRDFCGGSNDGLTSWKLTWSVQYDFFSLPDDLEDVGSAYRSVNGILAYNATCGDITCADPDS